jgi:hypothetical protein
VRRFGARHAPAEIPQFLLEGALGVLAYIQNRKNIDKKRLCQRSKVNGHSQSDYWFAGWCWTLQGLCLDVM